MNTQSLTGEPAERSSPGADVQSAAGAMVADPAHDAVVPPTSADDAVAPPAATPQTRPTSGRGRHVPAWLVRSGDPSRYAQGEIVTGLLYFEAEAQDLHASLNTVDRPLNELGERELCPGSDALAKFNATLR